MDEKTLLTCLKQIKTILDRHSITYWLDTGTLLGAVREKRFLPWDYDVDLGAWFADAPKIVALSNEFQNLGFDVCFFDFKHYIKLVKPSCEIDINLYVIQNNKATRDWFSHGLFGRIIDYLLWITIIQHPQVKKTPLPLSLTTILHRIFHLLPLGLKRAKFRFLQSLYINVAAKKISIEIPKSFFTTLTKIKFYKMVFHAPQKTEDYLKYRYGADWKTPKKDYIFTKDDQSIIA